MSKTVKDKIFQIIQKEGRGYVFSSKDFLPHFKRWEVDRSLMDLAKANKIIRIMTGLYYYPEYSHLLKKNVSPDMAKVAKAIARKFDWTIFPEGNTALNYLGLSKQVPAKYIYLSSGRRRQYKIGNFDLDFRSRRPSEISIQDEKTNLVIQAIISLGKTYAGELSFMTQLSKCFSYDEWLEIEVNAKNISLWVLNIITKAKDLARG